MVKKPLKIVALTPMAGPYILARYRAFAYANPNNELCLVEFGRLSHEYEWAATTARQPFSRHHLFDGYCEDLAGAELRRRLFELLDRLRPDVLVVAGYGVRGMLHAVEYSVRSRRDIRCVLLSESTEIDAARWRYREYVKSRLLRFFDAALVGGGPQRRYLMKLAMLPERIYEGCNVVDSSHFGRVDPDAEWPEYAREGYFLSVARMVAKKNLQTLLLAYQMYRQNADREPRQLVLVGDGPQRTMLQSLCAKLEILESVKFVGFLQYNDLPSVYHRAACFILPSLVEQWGLVVNEAMAAGLPVLVSNRCGCAENLVRQGENGFTFDPAQPEILAALMQRIDQDSHMATKMGAVSRELMSEWTLERFAVGLTDAVNAAQVAAHRPITALDRAILWCANRL